MLNDCFGAFFRRHWKTLLGRSTVWARERIAIESELNYFPRTRVDRNLTILLAEDNEDYALILEAAMKSIGWSNPIRIVPDGKEVIKYLSGDGKYSDREAWPFPSVMFIDIKMPLADGFDVLRWVRSHPDCSVMPTMMLSSSDDDKDVRLAYELGANAYFVKPSDVGDLKAILRAAYEFWAWCTKPKLTGHDYGSPVTK